MEASTPGPEVKLPATSFAGDAVALRAEIGEELSARLLSFRLDLEMTLRRVVREESSKRQVPADVPEFPLRALSKNSADRTEPTSPLRMPGASLREAAHANLPGSVGSGFEGVDSKELEIRCSCGNLFLDDTQFCRKCGEARPKDDSSVWQTCDEAQESNGAMLQEDTEATKSDNVVLRKSTTKKMASHQQPKTKKMALFAQEDLDIHHSRIQWLTNHKGYEMFSAALIIVNTLWLGYQTQHLALLYQGNADRNEPLGRTPASFWGIELIFCFLFFWELTLRWIADGLLPFLQSQEKAWNILDIVVVSTSLFELLLDIISKVTSSAKSDALQNVSVLRVLRVVRIVRVARVIRVMRFFRELRMMIFAILGCVKNLMWVMVVLFMTFYMFAILFVTAAVDHLDTAEKWRNEENEDLVGFFGRIDMAILSLFMAMSGGDDWSAFYNALGDLPLYYRFAFLLFIAFCLFAVINIVTGVFVESALQANVKDRDIVVHEEMQNKKEYLQQMRDLFEEMDGGGNETISIQEFQEKLMDERVIAYFNCLKLDVSDAKTLFHLIDDDGSEEIGIDEFLIGCYKLQGESRSLDMKIMQSEVHVLEKKHAAFRLEALEALTDVRAMLSTLTVAATDEQAC